MLIDLIRININLVLITIKTAEREKEGTNSQQKLPNEREKPVQELVLHSCLQLQCTASRVCVCDALEN